MKTSDHNSYITLGDVSKDIFDKLSIDYKLSPSEIIDVLLAGNSKGLAEAYELLFIGRKFEEREDVVTKIEEPILSLGESKLNHGLLESLLTYRGAVLHF